MLRLCTWLEPYRPYCTPMANSTPMASAHLLRPQELFFLRFHQLHQDLHRFRLLLHSLNRFLTFDRLLSLHRFRRLLLRLNRFLTFDRPIMVFLYPLSIIFTCITWYLTLKMTGWWGPKIPI